MKPIKCVVWDLDHTLWDGILLEGDNVRLKPGIPEILQTLDERGILLSIASRNDMQQAMEQLKKFAIDHYFLYPQINWNAKSASLARIQQSLNIGMDAILFIDDQQFELDEVKAAHPTVITVHAAEYMTLLEMEALKPKIVTEDSKNRRLMYIAEMKRKAEEESYVGPPSGFLAGLNMVFTISRARESDLLRAEELTVRTNQLNSTGIVYSYDQLKELLDSPRHHVLICELTDKYGSYGKIGLALVEEQGEYWYIRLLLMSCRIVSRGVGTVLLSYIMKMAKSAGKKLRADFIRTDRNRQMLLTYQLSNFKQVEKEGDKIVFENDLCSIQDYPDYIKVVAENIAAEGVVG